MAKFVYKMQNILDVKYKLEDQAKSAYSLARAKLNEEESKLRSFQKKKQEYEDRQRNLINTRLDILEIKICKTGIDKMKEEITKQLVAVHVAEKNLEAARVKLSEVMIDRKTHEKLRENAFEEFMKELQAQESKEIDELVSYSYGKSV